MVKLIVILLIGLACESVGVVFLKRGLEQVPSLKEVSFSSVTELITRTIMNYHVLSGVFFEALFFISLLMLMSRADVSFVWPLTSLSFVFATVAAKIYLHEYVSPARWAGVCLIMMGAALIIGTEKSKSAPGETAHVTEASPTGMSPPQ